MAGLVDEFKRALTAQKPIVPKATDIQTPLERRRTEVERVDNAAVKIHKVSGEIYVTGSGEATATVPFPVTFIEKPQISFGGELAPGSFAVDGDFPTVSLVVMRWNTVPVPNGFYYKGATFAIVTGGPDGQNMIVQWHVEAHAFRNPINGLEGVDQVL